MDIALSRRNFFKGAVASTLVRFLPSLPATVPLQDTLVRRPLNPFDAGSSNLTRMVLALMDDADAQETVAVLRTVPSFMDAILDDVAEERVGEVLTQHLGPGEWSNWHLSATDARRALASLGRRERLMRRLAQRYVQAETQTEDGDVDYREYADGDVSIEA